jgi:hypothetical protein
MAYSCQAEGLGLNEGYSIRQIKHCLTCSLTVGKPDMSFLQTADVSLQLTTAAAQWVHGNHIDQTRQVTIV